ncbi:MAG: universal stress protein [Haloferacaceae archaeon]
MEVLVPMDTSECSRRALEDATEVVSAVGGSIDVVHFTDVRDEAAEALLDDAVDLLEMNDVAGEVEIASDVRVNDPRPSTHIGKRVLRLVEERGYDRVVMGHHGTGRIGRMLLGSSAETVVKATEIPVTIVP